MVSRSREADLMKKQIMRIIEISCPLVQTMEMIDMMVAFHYRANLHVWNAPEKTVKKNLVATMMVKFENHGHGIIVDEFFEYFQLGD
jgi:hypothetical protein